MKRDPAIARKATPFLSAVIQGQFISSKIAAPTRLDCHFLWVFWSEILLGHAVHRGLS
jgi:hypothetical protein